MGGYTTIAGIAAVFIMIVCSVAVGGVEALKFYIHIPSIAITFGGATLSVFAMCRSGKVWLKRIGSFRAIFHKEVDDIDELIQEMMELALAARKEGLLALESKAETEEMDSFLKKGILLVTEGCDAEMLKSILKNDIDCIDIRHGENIEFWEKYAAMGPAWGMIGTLIGLINMLIDMGEDAAAIGPAMATALITTFYGSLLANAVCTPVAERLRDGNDHEILRMELMLQGVLSIQNGDNPHILEEKMRSFLKEEAKKHGVYKEALDHA